MGLGKDRSAMGIDINRVAASAIDATLNGEQSKRRSHSTTKALLLGATAVTVARAGKERLPGGAAKMLVKAGARRLAPNIRSAASGLRERFAKPDEAEDEAQYEDEEWDESDLEDEEDEDPEGEEDEDPEDEEDEDPEGEEDEDWDEESDDDEPQNEEDDSDPEDEDGEDWDDDDSGDDDQPRGGRSLELEDDDEREPAARDQDGQKAEVTADLMQVLREVATRPPVARRRTRKVDPAARPPARPPQERHRSSKDRDEPRSRQKNSRARQA
jgi:hypothetical protein